MLFVSQLSRLFRPGGEVSTSGLPGGVEQRMLRPDQLPHVHGDVTELIAEKTPETHEGRRISDQLLGVRHHFAPAGQSAAGRRPQSPGGRSQSQTGGHSSLPAAGGLSPAGGHRPLPADSGATGAAQPRPGS